MTELLKETARQSPLTTAFTILAVLTCVCMVIIGVPWVLH